nr:M23 family metallopeptidase [Planosporangium flavigriseum]
MVATASLPAGAELPLPPLPGPVVLPLPVPTQLPSLPALPPAPPIIKLPAPPAAKPNPVNPAASGAPVPGQPAPAQQAPAQPAPQPSPAAPAVTPGTIAAPDAAAAIIASDPGADLYPQLPVDPATTPQSRLAARLDEVNHRAQYLQNILIRTRSDLAVAQSQLGAVPPLVTLLTDGASTDGASPAQPAPGSVGTAEGRVLALTSAIDSGRAELARRQTEALDLQRQVNAYAAQAVSTTAPAVDSPAGYRGGKLLKPVGGPITSTFGNRLDPYYHVWQLHAGIDIGAPAGTQILAAAAGRVVQAGWSGGYGNYTCIDHGQIDGHRLTTCYGHQQKLLVAPGQQVSAGQVIGLIGSTGASTGPHLHFEVRLGGRPVDPQPWI